MVGIFKAKVGDSSVAFFGCDDATLVNILYEQAAKLDASITHFSPDGEITAKRIAEVVIENVDDDDEYIVNPVGKPETGRAPDGEAGTWTIQSLIFSKDKFDMDKAKKWVEDHEGFGNYGVEETDTSYRFRQYDPGHFSEFRTVPITDGIAAVYGKIGKSESDDSSKALDDSIKMYMAVRKINESLMEKGVKLLCGTASSMVKKGEDGSETEERYILSMVLEPNDGEDGSKLKPDTQDDIYSKSEVRKACHTWMEYYGAVDLMHSWKAIGKEDVRILENYIAPVEFKNGDDVVAEGSWMLALRVVNDKLWKAIKDGELGAYSIGGTANRVPLKSA